MTNLILDNTEIIGVSADAYEIEYHTMQSILGDWEFTIENFERALKESSPENITKQKKRMEQLDIIDVTCITDTRKVLSVDCDYIAKVRLKNAKEKVLYTCPSIRLKWLDEEQLLYKYCPITGKKIDWPIIMHEIDQYETRRLNELGLQK